MKKKMLISAGIWGVILLVGIIMWEAGSAVHHYATRTPQQALEDDRADWRVVECGGRFAVQQNRGFNDWWFVDKDGFSVYHKRLEEKHTYETLAEAKLAIEVRLRKEHPKAFWKVVE